jgi:HSP20 family protein
MLSNVSNVSSSPARTAAIRWLRPPIDLREATDGSLVAYLDVPGVKRDALTLEVVQNTLTVTAQRSPTLGYRWVFELPERLEADRIGARLADGVLEVTLHRMPAVEPRRITVG